MEASQEAVCNRDVVMVRRGVHRETPRGPLVTLPVFRHGVSGLPLSKWILSIGMTRLWPLGSSGEDCTPNAAMAAPRPGDKILVLRPCWLDLVLSGEKTLEIRGKNLSAGTRRSQTSQDFPRN